jgi:hypothetical protein
MQGWRDVAVTVAMHAQVCAMVQESLNLMALVATEATQHLSGTERGSSSTAFTSGTDRVSRCFAMLDKVLVAAGRTQDSGTGLTGATSSSQFHVHSTLSCSFTSDGQCRFTYHKRMDLG